MLFFLKSFCCFSFSSFLSNCNIISSKAHELHKVLQSSPPASVWAGSHFPEQPHRQISKCRATRSGRSGVRRAKKVRFTKKRLDIAGRETCKLFQCRKSASCSNVTSCPRASFARAQVAKARFVHKWSTHCIRTVGKRPARLFRARIRSAVTEKPARSSRQERTRTIPVLLSRTFFCLCVSKRACVV